MISFPPFLHAFFSRIAPRKQIDAPGAKALVRTTNLFGNTSVHTQSTYWCIRQYLLSRLGRPITAKQIETRRDESFSLRTHDDRMSDRLQKYSGICRDPGTYPSSASIPSTHPQLGTPRTVEHLTRLFSTLTSID